MHSPRPYALAVEGGELTDQDRLFIDHIATKVTNFKEVSALKNIKYTRALPDGGVVIVYDMAGIFKAIAYKEIYKENDYYDGFAPMEIPMLYSGVVVSARSIKRNGVSLTLTEQCCKRLSNYKDINIGKNQILKRFSIGFSPYFQELKPKIASRFDEDELLFTQFSGQYPTWYSGAMSELVQIVAGYGKQEIDKDEDNYLEKAVFTIPEKYRKAIEEKLNLVRLPAYSGRPNLDGYFEYSYTFYKTNLVSFDDENNPWLIQIEQNNVWAMPLPMIPATMTEEFRKYVEEVGDHELESILDRFGGLPSGETFPSGSIFHSWVRAGVIIKVCDTSSFYNYSAYSSASGWSSNSKGNEAINTCFEYRDDGFCYGYTFMLNLQLGKAENRGLLKTKTVTNLEDRELRLLEDYIKGLYQYLIENQDARQACIMYKLRIIDKKDILNRANRTNFETEVSYWDDYILPPIANHKGSIVITNEGCLYSGMNIKLPEPYLKACVSMDFTPQKERPHNYPLIDTIVYGYYIGDDLKVIKCFLDERKYIRKVEGNFDDYMTVGSYEQIITEGSTGLYGDYYSSDFDDRTTFALTTTTTKIEGRDLGYGKPLAAYLAYFWTDGLLRRSKYYSHKTKSYRTSGQYLRISFIVNYFNRNMCTYFKNYGTTNAERKESLKLHSMVDPNSYKFWTYDWSWHWYDAGGKKTAKPFPKDSVPVWAEEHIYQYADPRSDFADSGDWIGAVPADITHFVNPPNGDVTHLIYGGDAPTIEEYEEVFYEGKSDKNVTKVSIFNKPFQLNEKKINETIFTRSPDLFDNFVYQDACKVVFGTATYANIGIHGDTERHRVGFTKLADHKSAHFFIGVINE